MRTFRSYIHTFFLSLLWYVDTLFFTGAAAVASGDKVARRSPILAAVAMAVKCADMFIEGVKSTLSQYWLFLLRGVWLTGLFAAPAKAFLYAKKVETRARYGLTAGFVALGSLTVGRLWATRQHAAFA